MKISRALGALTALLTAAAPLAAQSDDYGRGGIELNVYGGVLNGIADEFEDDANPFTVDNDPLLGGRLGYVFPNNFFIAGEVGFLPTTLASGTSSASERDADLLRYGGALGYNIQVEKPLQLFVTAGAGIMRWDVDGLETESDFALNFGGGLRMFFTPWLALRLDVRDHLAPDGLADVRRALNPAVTVDDEVTQNVEWSGGLSLFLGGPRDADGDGVVDARDACPDTPRNVRVDGRGCPVDSDVDGVADYMDRCPDTPRGARVDGEGCPLDSDGDGVFDGIDRCEGTPRGATVDERGCPSDEDGDGVFDGIDQCEGTPNGATVDARGCPVDSDGDGVFDGLDRCPGTPAGAEVDENGCTVVEAAIERGRLVLENVRFAFDSAELDESSRDILDEVGRALVNRPGARVEIQGHTDAIGAEAYNQRLSQRRAQSVLDYLLDTFPELDADRFSARGYGESTPVASNDTEEGRRRNRRVEFVVQDD